MKQYHFRTGDYLPLTGATNVAASGHNLPGSDAAAGGAWVWVEDGVADNAHPSEQMVFVPCGNVHSSIGVHGGIKVWLDRGSRVTVHRRSAPPLYLGLDWRDQLHTGHQPVPAEFLRAPPAQAA